MVGLPCWAAGIMLLMSTYAVGADIDSVRLWQAPDYTRLVIEARQLNIN